MKIKCIHQFTPVLSKYDAIGKTILELQKVIIDLGYDSKIIVEKPIDQTSKITTKYTDYEPQITDLLLYHHSIGSDLVDFVCNQKNPKMLCYHNITRPHFFEKYDVTISNELQEGISQLDKLSNYFNYVMAASEFTKHELLMRGFKEILPFQYFLNLERFDNFTPDKNIIEKYSNTTNILFVGRKVPNKKIDDLIKIFAYYKILNPNSKLFVLGGSWSVEKYIDELEELKQLLRINPDDIVSIDLLSDEELASYYKIADVFLCMSEHEGFCIPLLEAMKFGVPIIAYNSTSVPNTLGECGILVNHKIFPEIAEMIDLITKNDSIKNVITQKQYKHMKLFSHEDSCKIFEDNLKCFQEKLALLYPSKKSENTI